MRLRLFASVFAFFAILLVLAILSCSKDEKAVDTGGNADTLYVKKITTSPDLQDIINDPLWDNTEEVAIRVGEEAAYSNNLGLMLVRARAMADNENVYMRFEWKDTSRSDRPGYWTYLIKDTIGCRVWTQNANSNCFEIINATNPRWENEDVLGLFFDTGNNGSEGANCATTCHASDPADSNALGYYHFTTGGGNIDVWIWRAGRTDPAGLADDDYWGSKDQLVRHDTHADVPRDLYWKNGDPNADYTLPGWMHTTGHGYTGKFLFTVDTTVLVQDVTAGWTSGDGVPGYVINSNWDGGNNSRFDVHAKSDYDSQLKRWKVVLWRKLETTTPNEDVEFSSTNKQVKASLCVMDHAFTRHSGSKVFTVVFQ